MLGGAPNSVPPADNCPVGAAVGQTGIGGRPARMEGTLPIWKTLRRSGVTRAFGELIYS